jgi:uncharacterized membrane protein YfcA
MFLSIVVLLICALLAFSLSAVCGGGASFILLPVLGWLLIGTQVPAALSVGTGASSFSRILVFRKNICWNIVVWFVPAALPAVWLGAYLLTFINPLYLELLLGLFLLSNIPLIFRPKAGIKTSDTMPGFVLIFIGAAAGFVSGLTGAVGLLFNKFYLRYGLSKEQIIATRAANELLLHLVKIGLYASFGLLTSKVLIFGFLIAFAAFISSWGMKRLLPYLSEKLFQQIGYTAMVVSGFVMFINASTNLSINNHLAIEINPIANGAETKLEWKRSTFALEFEYDEGFEVEHSVTLADIPAEKHAFVQKVSAQADKVILEEVFGINKHYYEVYVYKNKKIKKYDL